jgi:undecaprenyl-diphosphatase
MPEIDLSILYFFNRSLSSPWMDGFMSAITDLWWWIPAYIFGGGVLIWQYRWRALPMLLAVGLLITFTDQFAQLVLKPLVSRDRPCAEIDGMRVVEWIRLPIGMRHGPSFPSSHALNNAAVALFFGVVLRKKRLASILMGAALLIGISRVYLGLHYPSDILGGLVIGSLIGLGFAILYQRVAPEARRIIS